MLRGKKIRNLLVSSFILESSMARIRNQQVPSLSPALTKPQDVVGKTFVKQHVGVECGTLRLVLDEEGVRADAAIGVPHFAHSDAGTRAAAKGTEAFCGACAWTQAAFREGDARQEVKPASANSGC